MSALATSRVLLSIRAEHDYPLDPLGLPVDHTSGAVAGSDAGRLFIERAAAVRPGFELTDRNGPAIAQICELLDGLPLAIELAAARIKLFSPDALLKRLNERLELLTGGAKDAHPRHRALRATVDWSYDLLSGDEQSFFRDLAVFSGGATIEAIEQVAGADALELLTALVNHSLVRRQERDDDDLRFSMLQTIRDYAIELLAEYPGAAEVRERHARYYLELAERSKVEGELKMEALAPLDDELDNARSALTWWLARADTDEEAALLGLRLAIALGRYWYTHGQAVEGDEWLDRALRSAPNAPDGLRAEGLRSRGVLVEQQRKVDSAVALLNEALALFRKVGDRMSEASCLNSLGIVARNQNDLDRAEDLLSQSASIRREIGDRAGTAGSLDNLGIVAVDRGDLDRAQRLFEESIAIDSARGDEWGVACALGSLGVVHLERGKVQEAQTAIERALRTFDRVGDLDGAVETMEALAGVEAAAGRSLRAARLGGAIDAIRRRVGIPLSPVDRIHWERWLERPRRELGDDFEGAWAEGAQMTTEQALSYALGESTLK